VALAPGTRLGPYEILEPLGAGGMGEVYRARDPRIDRTVALKVLPEVFFEDEERRARFGREARTLASLNHPGIAVLYSFEEVPGPSSSSGSSSTRHLLVMELVEGEGLDQKIAAGPLPLEETVSYARQIAEALAAAHEKGIVHRDLKPANVVVMKDGRAKILGFGLAKVAGSGDSAKADTTLPTDMKTREGVVMGTVPYMSPEQVSGRPLDHRTDIFSLGVILYEMATGQRPFQGDSPAELISSILRDTPRPPGELRKGLPGNLERMVQRCLEKSAADRVQSARQILDGLRDLTAEAPATPTAAAPASRPAPAADSGAARADEGFWVAVLPFKSSGSSAELTALAEALSEEIITGLSRFSYLRVISRSSTSRYANAAVDVRAVGKEIGARYVMEGSLRQAGTKLRLAVQLVDAASGAHLWAENFERTFSPETVFELQDDLVPRIVSTVADMYGVLPRSMSEALRGKADEELSPHEAVLSAFAYMERVTPEEHARVRRILERAVSIAPNQSDAWAMLANLYWEEHAHGLNPLPDPLGRALAASRRAVEAAPSNNLAHYALASTLFFQKDHLAFRLAAERAIELNRMDASVAAYIGNLIAYSGDWERGCALVESAMQLNPRHPGWYWFVNFNDAYRRRDYQGALGFTLKINLPGNFYTHAVIAMCYGQLGMREAARTALQELLAIRPDFAKTAREEFGRWFDDLAFIEHQLDGLRKAGLEVPSSARADPAVKPAAAVTIAVLPFTDMSLAKDQEYLCEGMAEEIMNALVGIGGIRVASRTSAFQARRQGADLPVIGKLLSVGQVLEGSVRTAGDRLRVTAQLTDVASGFQLWSERFDRKAEDVFAVQDEIAAGVVEAVRSRLGAGGPVIQARPQVRNLEAYQLYLKGRHLRFTKNDHGGALLNLERAVALEPSHGPSWVALADIHVLAAAYGIKPSSEANAEAKNELATAARLQGETGDARYVEGMIAFSERRWADADRAMARAMQIEPGNVQARCWIAMLLSIRGRTEEAIEALERAREIDPLAPYPYAMTGFCLLNVGRPADAGRFARQALAFDEDNILALWVSGAASVSLGQFDQAVSSLERAATRARANPFTRGTLGWVLAAAGRIDEAYEVLEALHARAVAGATVLSEAWLLAALEDMDGAFEVLRLACEEKQLLVPFTGMPGFDPLRSDPRFAAIVERMRLPSTTITA